MDFDTQFIRIFSGNADVTTRRRAVDLDYINSEAGRYERERKERLAAKVTEAREVWRLADEAARQARLRYVEAIARYDVTILDGKP